MASMIMQTGESVQSEGKPTQVFLSTVRKSLRVVVVASAVACAALIGADPAVAAPSNCDYGRVTMNGTLIGTDGTCHSGTGQHRAVLWCLQDGGQLVYGPWRDPGEYSYAECDSDFWGNTYRATYYNYQITN